MDSAYHHVHSPGLASIPTFHPPLHQIPNITNRHKLQQQIQLPEPLHPRCDGVSDIAKFQTSNDDHHYFYLVN